MTIIEYQRPGSNLESVDTFVVLYEHNANVHWTVYPPKMIVKDSSKNKITKEIFLFDSSPLTITEYYFSDSTILFTLKDKDTVSKETRYLSHGKTMRSIKINFDSSEEYYYEERTVKDGFYKIIVEYFIQDSKTSRVRREKMVSNRIFNTRKCYKVNWVNNKWVLQFREKYNHAGQVIKHIDLSGELKIKYTTRYNSYGQVILHLSSNGHYIEEKTIYIYEYY